MTGLSTTKDHGFCRDITLLCRRVDKGYVIECAYVRALGATIAAKHRNADLLKKHQKECNSKGLNWEKYWAGDPYFTKKVKVRDYG